MSSAKANDITFPHRDLAIRREGYTSLASWMTLDPDKEALIFRKFDYLFIERAEVQDSADEKRLALLDEIHSKLNEYHNTLVLESQVANLSAPPTRALKAYSSYFLSEGPMDRVIFGKAQAALDDDQDLVTVQPAPETDVLSRFVGIIGRSRYLRAFKSTKCDSLADNSKPAKRNSDPDETTLRFREKRVGLIVGLLNIIAASVLIIGAAVGLFKLRKTPDSVRLGSIAGFTAFFAITLGLLTNAKRAEIFAATAAYAAVLVVFVSGDLGGSGGIKV